MHATQQDAQQTTRRLQGAIDEVQGTGRSPSEVRAKRGHRTVAERRRAAFVAFCRQKDEWSRYRGNWIVPDEQGAVIASAPNEENARAAGAAYLHWRPKSVVVIPLAVEGCDADIAADALAAEFDH